MDRFRRWVKLAGCELLKIFKAKTGVGSKSSSSSSEWLTIARNDGDDDTISIVYKK